MNVKKINEHEFLQLPGMMRISKANKVRAPRFVLVQDDKTVAIGFRPSPKSEYEYYKAI